MIAVSLSFKLFLSNNDNNLFLNFYLILSFSAQDIIFVVIPFFNSVKLISFGLTELIFC